jgi:beta-phosphoglucomutase-like phosphatase (HAD superfamily)
MKKKKNLIVFDIDGTLADSVNIHQEAFKQSLNLIGVKEFNDKFGAYLHHTDSHIAKVILRQQQMKCLIMKNRYILKRIFIT